ncbi:MAG: hypothetical protein WCF36_10240 [Candidatus Nanopelagicales bacterium]
MATPRLIPLTLAGTLLLAACSSGTGDEAVPSLPGEPSASAPVGGAPIDPSAAEAAAVPVAAAREWAHVHNLTLDGDLLRIGTHEGLWSQAPGQPAQQVSDQAFDVMGFAQAGPTTYSSGHPGDDQDAPADLGLQTSADGGRTWASKSLLGEVDFHRLRAQDSTVQGLSAHDGRFLRSNDSGATWSDLGAPELFDFALDPTDSRRVIGTRASGPVRSTDGGRTFQEISDAPRLAFLAWTGPTVYAIATDNTLHVSTDAGTTWAQAGELVGQPQALGADGDRVVALAGSTIWESSDAGRTFTPRITGLAAH